MIEFYGMIASGFGCFVLTAVLIPICIKVAASGRMLDYPGRLKVHKHPIPRVGGIAIFLSSLLVSLLTCSLPSHISLPSRVLIGLGLFGIFVLGLVDDGVRLSAKIKFRFQFLCSLLAVLGLYATHKSTPFIYFFPLVVFFIGLTNAFNLLDGIDGLAAGVAVFISLGLLVAAILVNNQPTYYFLWLIIGSSLGFLLFNHSPARVFLGDCGSTLLGFSLALLMCTVWLHATNALSFLPLLVIAGVPIIDTSCVIIRRLLKRKPIFAGDRSHSYDMIMQRGFSLGQTVLLFYASGLFLSVSGIVLFVLVEFP